MQTKIKSTARGCLASILVAALGTFGARSNTIHVPADYPTIQAAIGAAAINNGDVILVSPGTYHESLNFSGKAISLTSSGGAAVTIINAAAGVNGLNFVSGEASNTIVSGFTILNGGIGTYISGSSPTILSNVFQGNTTAISCDTASPTVRDNVITQSSATSIVINGAGTALFEGNQIQGNQGGFGMNGAGSPTFRNNLIQGNAGAGFYMMNYCDANIIQNVIVDNTSYGIYWLVPSGGRGPYVINNTIVNNGLNTGASGIGADGHTGTALVANNIIVGNPAISVGNFNNNIPPIVQFNDVYNTNGPAYAGIISNLTGIAGNISAEPFFTCEAGVDYRLLPFSPCIDAGSNGVVLLPSLDIAGNARILSGTSNGPAIVDMGAYEYNPASPTTPCMYVNCPSNIVVGAQPGQNSAVVNYPPPTGAPLATLMSSPPSGSTFPAGTNTVICTATYGTNVAACSFTITVLLPPSFTNPPATVSVAAGQSFSLSTTPGGYAPFVYSWLFEKSLISGATSNTLTISNAQAVNEGIYLLVASNFAGVATSAVMSVQVIPAAPLIVNNPVSLTLPETTNAAFRVGAVGSQPFSYEWLFNGNPVAGASTSQFTISGIRSTNAGSYQVIVTNGMGAATSSVATLTVTPKAPFFIVQPTAATVSAGTTLTLAALADGTQPIAYQWLLNGLSIDGATQTSLTLSNLAPSNGGTYLLMATNVAGSGYSSPALLRIVPAVGLSQPLTNVVVDYGSNVVLAVGATGGAPLAYSWQLNGQPLAATNFSLTISNIQFAQSGFYRVTVTNQYGSTSSVARVSVLGLPGQLTAWGDNSGGQTSVPTNLGTVVAVSGGDYHTAALHHDGTLAAWGYNGDGQTSVPTNVLRFVTLASGAAHNLTVTETGSVVAWGRNDAGQCNVPAGTSNAVLSVTAGDAHSLALLNNGTVTGWGDNSLGQISIPGGLNGVKVIAAGREHSLALRTNGTVVAWGYNTYRQASVPAGLSNVVAIAGGYLHSAALRADGTVAVWGDNSFGQTNVPSSATNVVAIGAGDFHTLALRIDGTLLSWGDNSLGQTAIPANLKNAIAVSCGNYHSLTLVYGLGPLQINQLGPQLIITWSGPGVLQSSPAPLGPFSDIPVQGNSYTNSYLSWPNMFFRLRK